MTMPVNEGNGVNYGYGVVAYTPPVGYQPGSYMDPQRPVPGGNLNNYTTRSALDIEAQLVSGQKQYSQLSEEERRLFSDQLIRNKGYLTPGNTYNPDSLKTLDQEFRDYLDRSEPNFRLPGWMKPLEWLGSKMYWAYSNFVSRPISSVILYASQLDRGDTDFNDAWDAARYTSPGQAATMMFMTDNELRENGIDPHNIAGSKDAVDQFFRKGPQKWTSGITDFAVSWYADPFVVALKGVGATRRASYVKRMDPTRIDSTMQSGAMTGLLNLVDEYKLKYGIDEGAARLVKQVPSFFRSNNGSGARLAEALMKSENMEDMTNVMRMSLGDRATLLSGQQVSAQTAAMIGIRSTEESTLTTSYAARTDQTTPEAIREKNRLDAIAAEMTQLEAQLARTTRENSLFGTFDKMYFNSVTTPLGATVRGMFYDAQTSFAKKGDAARRVLGVPARVGATGPVGAVARVAYNGLYVAPIRFARSFTDDAPVQYIRLADPDSHRAVNALLRDASMLSPEFKAQMVGRYINAAEVDRPMVLQRIEGEAVAAMANRHGLDAATANALYRDFYGRRAAVSSGSNNYSTANLADGTPVHVVEKGTDGSVVTISPVLSSQMANSWIMMDFKRMDKLMRQQGPVIQRLLRDDPNLMDKARRGVRISGDTLGGVADTLNSTWKFLQLARIGYGPRAIADEFMGQIAALGPLAFIERSAQGANNFFRGGWLNSQREAQAMMRSSMDDLVIQQTKLVENLERKMAINNTRQSLGNISASKRRQLRRDYAALQARHSNELETLNQVRGRHGSMIKHDTMNDSVRVGTLMFRGPLEAEGAAYRSHLSAEDSMRNLLGPRSGALGRSMHVPGAQGWARVSAAEDETKHMQAWLRAINNQIRTDPLALIRAGGGDDQAMMRFMRSAQGRSYKAESPFKSMTDDEIIERVGAHVDEYLPANMLGRDEIGTNILARDLTGDELKAAIPRVAQRPDVHAEQLDYGLGGPGFGGDIARVADQAISGFYKVMNQLPAERLSRNPLFAQLYKTHLEDMSRAIPDTAYLTPGEFRAYENAARTRALRDVKRLTFNMDYESRIAHALRFVAPFFGAQMESWTRWARIVADKPQTVAHAVNLYNSPMRSGNATTYDGDKVDGYGYATNQVTGEKYKVDKSDIYLNVPVPKAMLNEMASLTGRDVESMRIPINSLNLVLSGEPVFMPGFGPVVQIPANDFIQGGPLSPFDEGHWESEQFFKEIGVLPYGPRESVWDFINPASGRRFADSENEYSDKYQKTLMAVMAEEQWKYDEGLRETAPTLKESMDRARKFTKFEMWANFVLPFTAGFTTPQQFYGDMYRKMVKEDPEGGADKFRDKYGDSMWMFTAQLTRNNTSLSATSNAVFSQKKMQEAVDLSSSEFAGEISHILSGPYATGDWSAGAYYYQLNNPVQTGGTEMQRERIGAIEALDRAEEQRGWYLYNQMMLPVYSELYRRGLRSFDDKGAEDLRGKKIAAAEVLSDPMAPDGKPNPYYNEQWSKRYNTFDTGKYDRFASNLEQVFGHIAPMALSQSGRTDLGSLYKYLELRKSVKSELLGRESQDINAKSNRDIKRFMTENTMALIEKDTRFNELHNRYFSRDMGFDNHFLTEG